MSILNNINKVNVNIINYNYKKIKINYFFSNFNFIIYFKNEKINFLKNKLSNYNIFSLILNNKFIKSLFKIPNFSFLKGDNLLCIFINDIKLFINIIQILEKVDIFYSYKNSYSNITNTFQILNDFNKYNFNFSIIQFIIKKLIIKIILIINFFILSFIINIK
jgi:hypothetical protein